MPKLNHSIDLRQDFCWRNRGLMGRIAPQERKMFFLPFAVMNPEREYKERQVIDVPLSVVVTFLQCKADINEDALIEALREGFKAIKAAAKGNMPYIFKGIKNGNARFILQDCSIFSGLEKKSKCTFDLDEISAYADGSIRDNKPVPLLWFVQCVVVKFFDDNEKTVANTAYPLCEVETDNKDIPTKLFITVGHTVLKNAMGYDKFDYTNIPRDPENPKANREFLLDFVSFQPKIYKLKALQKKNPSESDPEKRRQNDWAIHKLLSEHKAFEEKYDNMPIETLQDRYNRLWKKTQHRYQPFVDKVVKPAIAELNNGNMLHFCLIDNQRKPAKRTQEQIAVGEPPKEAILEQSYVQNNYAKKKTKKVVATAIFEDEHGKVVKEEQVYSEINNYKQRKKDAEHTICIDLQHWFSCHNKGEQAVTEDATKPVAEIAPSVEEVDLQEDVPFTVGKPYSQEKILCSCDESNEDEELPFSWVEPCEEEELPFFEDYEQEEVPFTVGKPYPLKEVQLQWFWDDNDDLPFN